MLGVFAYGVYALAETELGVLLLSGWVTCQV